VPTAEVNKVELH